MGLFKRAVGKAPPRPWTVLGHGEWEKHEENLWCIRGDIPEMQMPLKRTMTVVRRAGGGLFIHSAIALGEAHMRELEAWGWPELLVVPNGWHRLDAHAYKARYPSLRVFCPVRAQARVREVVEPDGLLADFPADEVVRAEPLDGFDHEGVFIVRSGAAVTLLFNDVFMNQPHLPGVEAFFYRLLGATGGPRIHPIMKRMSRRGALKAHLLRLAELPGLARLIPGHGDPVGQDAARVLREAARGL